MAAHTAPTKGRMPEWLASVAGSKPQDGEQIVFPKKPSELMQQLSMVPRRYLRALTAALLLLFTESLKADFERTREDNGAAIATQPPREQGSIILLESAHTAEIDRKDLAELTKMLLDTRKNVAVLEEGLIAKFDREGKPIPYTADELEAALRASLCRNIYLEGCVELLKTNQKLKIYGVEDDTMLKAVELLHISQNRGFIYQYERVRCMSQFLKSENKLSPEEITRYDNCLKELQTEYQNSRDYLEKANPDLLKVLMINEVIVDERNGDYVAIVGRLAPEYELVLLRVGAHHIRGLKEALHHAVVKRSSVPMLRYPGNLGGPDPDERTTAADTRLLRWTAIVEPVYAELLDRIVRDKLTRNFALWRKKQVIPEDARGH